MVLSKPGKPIHIIDIYQASRYLLAFASVDLSTFYRYVRSPHFTGTCDYICN